jgi:hypothetical protein
MITAAQLTSFHRQTVDFEETELLKAKLAHLRSARQPFFLTALDFEEILMWKLGQQHGRQRALRAANTDEIIRAITGLALTITVAEHDKVVRQNHRHRQASGDDLAVWAADRPWAA